MERQTLVITLTMDQKQLLSGLFEEASKASWRKKPGIILAQIRDHCVDGNAEMGVRFIEHDLAKRIQAICRKTE